MAICEQYIVYQGNGPERGPFPIQTLNGHILQKGDLIEDSGEVYEVIRTVWSSHSGLYIRTHEAQLRNLRS